MGIEVSFTTKIETFVAHEGLKISYTSKQLGEEIHIKSASLLFEQGVNTVDIHMTDWDGIPAFFQTSEQSIIPYDIFAASFYLLSRYEEYLPHMKDEQGRFPAKESMAFQKGFLALPLVDLWIARFKKIITQKNTAIHYKEKEYKVSIAVEVQRAFAYRKIGFLRTLGGYGRDLMKFHFKQLFLRTQVLIGFRKDPFNSYSWLIQIQKRTQHKLQLFFALGDYSSDNRVIKHSKTDLQSLLKMIADYSDLGLLVSKDATRSATTLKKERKRMETISLRSLKAVKMIHNSIELPSTYQNILEEEVTTDYSMSYPDQAGFRASTCSPFLFYDLNNEIQTPLLLCAPCFHIDQVYNTNKRTIDTLLINTYKETIQKLNGLYLITFSNESLSHKVVRNFFKETLTHES